MKKKILIVTSWFPGHESPVSGIFVRDQAQCLRERYDVAVLVPGITRLRDVPGRGRIAPVTREEQDGLAVFRSQAVLWIPRNLWFKYASYLRGAARALRRIQSSWGSPDLIHAHVMLPAGWVAVKLARRLEIPVVLTTHSDPFAMHLQTAFERQLVSQTLHDANRILAVSPGMLQQICAFQPPHKSTVLGNLIKTSFFTPSDRPADGNRPVTFLLVALLVPKKGVNHLLRAARILRDRGRESFRLEIGGDGPFRPALEKEAADLGLSAHCSFLGLLSPEQVRDRMRLCDALVVASLSETFGIVAGEAMACGKPVIATRCGGPEYVVTPETGLLVEKANPTALADAMESLMTGRRRFDGKAIRDYVVTRFGEEAFLRQMSEVYQQEGLR